MSKISSEYAKALYKLAREGGNEKNYLNTLDMISGLLLENPQYIELLKSAAIPMEERLAVLDSAFSDAVPKNILSFMKILCQNGHIGEILDCCKSYSSIYDRKNSIKEARVISATNLTESERERITEKLEKMSGASVETEFFLDESILGGLIVEIDGKTIDSSIRRHLADVKEVIAK